MPARKTVATVPKEVERDRYGRPKILQPDGSTTAYRRVTTFIDVLEDKYHLTRWELRMVALGLAERPDLMLRVTAADVDDRDILDKVCADAKEAAKGHAKATEGSALHKLTELIDTGQKLPPLPANAKASLETYAAAVKGFRMHHIEQMTVWDSVKVAGTPDRIISIGRKQQRYIFDLKTGKGVDLGYLKMSMQLGTYAMSKLYDVETGERSEHGASIDWGLIAHMPSVEDPADASTTLYWVDLRPGRQAVDTAKKVWAARSVRHADVFHPFTGDGPPELEAKAKEDRPAARPPARKARARKQTDEELLLERIEEAPSKIVLKQLWLAYTDRHAVREAVEDAFSARWKEVP